MKSGDWDGLVRYAEKLEKIGATQALACVTELIDLLKPAKEFGDAALFESIKAEKKAIKIISERYNEEAEDIGNLSQFFVSSQGSSAPSMPEPPFPMATNGPEETVAMSEEPPGANGEETAEPDSAEKSDGMSANHDLPMPKTPSLDEEPASTRQDDHPAKSTFSSAP